MCTNFTNCVAKTIRKNISAEEKDIKLILTYCNTMGFTFSGFLIRCAKQEIRGSPTRISIQGGLWEKIFK